ncbi:MAG: hypothetical protein KBF78_09745 [Fuscovulum sp.]|nr:hypothetical protein [Fuscovulum sp.]
MRIAVALLVASLGLAGCVGNGEGAAGQGIASEYATACMFELNPPGAYSWNDGDSEVQPGLQGTADGAARLNACIRAKAEAAGKSTASAATQPLPDVAGVPQSAATTAEGNRETVTYTYGTPPAGTRKSGGMLVADTAVDPAPKASRPAPTASRPAPAPGVTSGYCSPGGGALQGGTSYCIGN